MKQIQSISTALQLTVLLLISSASTVFADLKPAEIAIIANKNSQQSQQLAGYYAQKRGVPASQICLIDVPVATEEISRADWDTKVRPAIRRWVASNQLQNKIRCMLTVWDVPLKIGKQLSQDSATKRRLRLLQMERERRVQRLLDFSTQFDQIAGGTPTPVTLTTSASLQDVTKALAARLKASEGRIQAMTVDTEKQAAISRLTQLSVATAGLQVVTQNLQRTIQAGNTNERIASELQIGRGRLAGLGEGQALLDGLPASIERDTNLIALIERATGIAGTIGWIDGQLDLLQKNETHSSFDSELALVLESTGYPLLRWLPNYLHFNYDGSPLREITRTLMVSRIDAPSLALAKGIIDKSMEVEKQGLKGKVYLDARGIATLDGPAPRRGSEEDYDRSLLLAEKLLKTTDLTVVLNNAVDLFKPGECPDAALYCGWFSLAKYVDAFEWNPGSIGYHMTSSEASTLRKPDSQVWCKQMLERGVAGTIGPVYEPYFLAFPRANEFFALLCSGKLSYIECVYRTKATNSWNMTTVGDPLYNPFKAKPAITTPPPEYARVFGDN